MARAPQKNGLTDTDILIDASRGLPQAGDFLNRQQAASGVIVSVITVMELISGCRDAAQFTEVRRLVEQFTVLPINEAVSNRARELMELFTLGHALLLPDAFIAATALEHNLGLYTRNVRHYRMIPGLEVLRPY